MTWWNYSPPFPHQTFEIQTKIGTVKTSPRASPSSVTQKLQNAASELCLLADSSVWPHCWCRQTRGKGWLTWQLNFLTLRLNFLTLQMYRFCFDGSAHSQSPILVWVTQGLQTAFIILFRTLPQAQTELSANKQKSTWSTTLVLIQGVFPQFFCCVQHIIF